MHIPGIGMGNDHRPERCTGSALLPPGFRFRPTDEELLTHYLARKAADAGFAAAAIREVDLYKAEPWDLLPAAAGGGDSGEDGCRYFFCTRRVKFPSGMRTNRATRAGYWKSTGKDRVVVPRQGDERGGPLGVKKTLVFYKGRAPRGDKTGWVMHEYRLLPGHYASCSQSVARGGDQIEWLLCRMFRKKPPGEMNQEQETVLHPLPCGDHLQMSIDGKTLASATAASSEPPNCFSNAEAITAPDDHEIYQGLLQLKYEDLLVNSPETYDMFSAALAPQLAQAMLLPEDLATHSSSSDDIDEELPQLLDCEGFHNFVHDF